MVYSDELTEKDLLQRLSVSFNQRYTGSLQHAFVDTLSPNVLAAMTAVKPSVSERPYTAWEKLGILPIHVSRLQPRQYYYPYTDFSKYEYDVQSPEEKFLRARWGAKLFNMNLGLPLKIQFWFAVVAAVMPSNRFRLLMLGLGGVAAVHLEAARVALDALPEREALDDFLVAKEIWFIKNVETREFNINTLEGQELLDMQETCKQKNVPQAAIYGEPTVTKKSDPIPRM